MLPKWELKSFLKCSFSIIDIKIINLFTIYKKELNSFFNSLIAYLVISVFLLSTSMYIWIIPEYNIFDTGFADLEILFDSAPFLFIFLIPAITMKSFAEEFKLGTLEILLTKPISEFEIILAKFFASLTIVCLALLPTLVYFYSIYQLASPLGNIDSAGILGSYLGLFLLASVFTASGIFASTLSDNQIVSFIVAIILSFFFYAGFQVISTLQIFSNFSNVILKFGIGYHYDSLSKGLIDSRDVFYFFASSIVLLFASKLVINARNWV